METEPSPAGQAEKTQQDNFALYLVETGSTVSWFFMDASWMFELVWPAQFLAVVTIILSLLIFCYTERSKANMLVTAAMVAWAGMNICWMLKDLDCWSQGMWGARAFFVLGLACLLMAAFVARSSQAAMDILMARFRRMRIPRPQPTVKQLSIKQLSVKQPPAKQPPMQTESSPEKPTNPES
jgi:hypothetical protein